jgi:8-oxo-dGTP pyrophosphatase MutT (NUDIX family)
LSGQPLRQSVASLAVIHRSAHGQTVWLAQWNAAWMRYHFVAGHKRADETFRLCLIREIGEELHLKEGTDFTVASRPVSHVEYQDWSQSAREMTSYVLELFEVTLKSTPAVQAIDQDPANRWLTEPELLASSTTDGKTISSTMAQFLSRANLLGGRF